MTPAERDEVRRIAAETIDAEGPHCDKPWLVDLARAVLRYVPPGDATTDGVPWTVGSPSIAADRAEGSVLVNGVCGFAFTPDAARTLAHAIHAAADAAEES